MLNIDVQKRLTVRLRRIEGQVRGLERMVSEPRLCVDLLTQIAAVQSALKSVGDEILYYHVRRCVPESFSRRLRNKERERLEEMEKIFVQYCQVPLHSEPISPELFETRISNQSVRGMASRSNRKEPPRKITADRSSGRAATFEG